MPELRIPTVSLVAEVVDGNGDRSAGQVFVPALAFAHTGVTRPEEWINAGGDFFPFLPDGGKAPLILNKSKVVVLIVASPADAEEEEEEEGLLRLRVIVECGRQRFEGTLLLDMPEGHRRVLDYLNRAERFMVLHEGAQRLLIRKDAITRLYEGPLEG